MARNGLGDLRDHLFIVIEKLQDGEIELDQAEQLNKVAKTIIAGAKVEAGVR